MEIQSQLSQDGKILTLTLQGKFDYTCHQAFQGAYDKVSPAPEKIIIDVLEISAIDSSALGMLLLLRNYSGGDDSDITIINAKPDIYKLLSTCKFDALFEIERIA